MRVKAKSHGDQNLTQRGKEWNRLCSSLVPNIDSWVNLQHLKVFFAVVLVQFYRKIRKIIGEKEI